MSDSVIRLWSVALTSHRNSLSICALAILGVLMPATALADQLIVTAGGGSQPHANQSNRSIGVDVSFFRHERTANQHLLLGVSYTRIRTDADHDSGLWAISIYPQLSLYPDAEGRFRNWFPQWASPYFFVRALGPSYLSSTRLGDREQAKHFAFQAQVGFGLMLDLGRQRTGIASLSWKHFSNANLYDQNDGIDIPLVLSLGMRF